MNLQNCKKKKQKWLKNFHKKQKLFSILAVKKNATKGNGNGDRNKKRRIKFVFAVFFLTFPAFTFDQGGKSHIFHLDRAKRKNDAGKEPSVITQLFPPFFLGQKILGKSLG